ncbi:glutaredoxin family protein [Onishia niordana]|uniref:glutaredoxin family protein n=1 Tax=Onishia niordana TaxID=2508711 RepID=UPI00109F205F|nr:glutaredoxin family protein [Halomonas niordiana]
MNNESRLTLYTTLGCHLCEELEAWLARLGPEAPALVRVEISDDAALLARYGERIPVLEDAAGQALERGFEPERLADWLAARSWLDHEAWRQVQQPAGVDERHVKGAVMRNGRRFLGGSGVEE